MTDNTDITKGGAKLDGNKPRWDLLPLEEVGDVAQVLTYGADKYAANNWRQVQRNGRYVAAGFRHLAAFQSGEDLDPESGLHHLAHAATNMLMALWLQKNHPHRDDRYKEKESIDLPWARALKAQIADRYQYSNLDEAKEALDEALGNPSNTWDVRKHD